MKEFKHTTFFKTLCMLCLMAFAQVLHAQTEDSVTVSADTVDAAATAPVEQKPVARPKSRPMFFAQVRSKAILAKMPQYQAVQRNMAALKEQYEAEAKKSEKDFQQKFEEFMQGHREFPKTILEKRQNELQSMLDANAAFRIKVQNLLAEAEQSMLADVMAELNDAINVVAGEKGVSVVFDLDGGSVPYVAPGLALDLTNSVLEYLLSEAGAQ